MGMDGRSFSSSSMLGCWEQETTARKPSRAVTAGPTAEINRICLVCLRRLGLVSVTATVTTTESYKDEGCGLVRGKNARERRGGCLLRVSFFFPLLSPFHRFHHITHPTSHRRHRSSSTTHRLVSQRQQQRNDRKRVKTAGKNETHNMDDDEKEKVRQRRIAAFPQAQQPQPAPPPTLATERSSSSPNKQQRLVVFALLPFTPLRGEDSLPCFTPKWH